MVRILIGSILGGIAQFLVGFVFWGTPLGKLAFTTLADAPTADLQTALARTLTATGTGTYFIPSPETPAGTALLGKGPVALVMFNTGGFAPVNPAALLVGLAMSVAAIYLAGVALTHVAGFAARLRVGLLFLAATVLYFIVAMPVYNDYMPWAWWLYSAVSSFVGFAAGLFVLLRWFMPEAASGTTPRP